MNFPLATPFERPQLSAQHLAKASSTARLHAFSPAQTHRRPTTSRNVRRQTQTSNGRLEDGSMGPGGSNKTKTVEVVYQKNFPGLCSRSVLSGGPLKLSSGLGRNQPGDPEFGRCWLIRLICHDGRRCSARVAERRHDTRGVKDAEIPVWLRLLEKKMELLGTTVYLLLDSSSCTQRPSSELSNPLEIQAG